MELSSANIIGQAIVSVSTGRMMSARLSVSGNCVVTSLQNAGTYC